MLSKLLRIAMIMRDGWSVSYMVTIQDSTITPASSSKGSASLECLLGGVIRPGDCVMEKGLAQSK